MDDALCLEHSEVEFFTERGQDSRPAKAVCARCLVQRQCLAYAMQRRIIFGIYGGSSESCSTASSTAEPCEVGV